MSGGANTGPKGVIEDWRRFKQLETEKREEQVTATPSGLDSIIHLDVINREIKSVSCVFLHFEDRLFGSNDAK
jgi:hypothetical protein